MVTTDAPDPRTRKRAKMASWLDNYRESERRDAAVATAIAALLSVIVGIIGYVLTMPAQQRNDASSSGPVAVGASATASSPSPSASEAASSSASAGQMGETQFGPNADTTLLQVRRVRAPSDRAPAAGQEWLGIRAKTCAHVDAEATGGLNWTAWAVLDSDSDRFDGKNAPWADFPTQQFVTDGIEPGACVVGWTLIEVPAGSFGQFMSAVFLPGSANEQTWEL